MANFRTKIENSVFAMKSTQNAGFQILDGPPRLFVFQNRTLRDFGHSS